MEVIMDRLKERAGGVTATLIVGLSCFLAGSSATGIYSPKVVVSSMGFHFPETAPVRGISEGKPPYCISLYKDNGLWRWIVYKHDPEERTIGGGATESYNLSRDIAVVLVDEDKKSCHVRRESH
jgi:hypothetical protein